MLRKLFSYLLLLLLLLAACAPPVGTEPTADPGAPVGSDDPTADPDAPVSSDDPTAEPTEPAVPPSEVVDNAGVVETIDVALMESFPLQAMAIVTGYFPNGCWSLENVAVEQMEETFVLNVRGRHSGAEVCTEALVPFEANAPLPIQGLLAGVYNVQAGEQKTTFELAVDNILEGAGDVLEGNMVIDNAPVSDVRAEFDAATRTLTVTISGDLPDGCTTIHEVTVGEEETGVIPVTVQTARNSELMCTMAIVPFTETAEIDVSHLSAGNYSVDVNGVMANFTIPEA